MPPAPRVRSAGLLAVLAIAALALSGCCTSKQCQLEKVAKDWCYTIRASQVIPVYPLTEDLQPGDVFLVQVPIDKQQKVYREDGFLPLDNHLDRLDPDGYPTFYSHSFDPGASVLPKTWMTRDAQGKSTWKDAPHASFPTYSFSTSRGGGLSVALPVQGVPVGLSLLGSDAANGSISIKQAKTIGVDTRSLYAQLTAWAALNRDFLRNFGPGATGRQNYLRVVSRVYATGKMDVFLSNASSYAAGADVGAPKPVELLTPKPPKKDEDVDAANRTNYTDNIAALNKTIADGQKTTSVNGVDTLLPGGSVRITAATARTVSLSETFDTPLVLGYLGFDCAILGDGRLGPPIPTHAVIDSDRYGGNIPTPTPAETSVIRRLNGALYDVLAQHASGASSPRQQAAAEIKSRLDSLAEIVPAEPTAYAARGPDDFTTIDMVAMGAINADRGTRTYRDFNAYRGAVETASNMLDRLSKADAPAASEERFRVAASQTREALRRLDDAQLRAREHAAATDAIQFVIDLDQ